MFNKKAIFQNTFWQVVVRVAALVFTLISIKLLTNYLGTNGVGEYNTITTYVNFFLVIADLGLFSVTVREISKNPSEEKKIVSNVFVIRLVSALLACAAAIIILLFTPYRSDSNLFYGVIIGCGFLFFNLLASIFDMILQYRLKMQFSAIAELLSKLISLIALFIVVRLDAGFLWVASTIALSGILIFFFKYLFSLKFIQFTPKYDQKIAKWIFNISWPLGVVFIVNNLFFKLDTLMLFVIKGASAVGIYSVAYKVLEVTVFIGSYFSSALKPTLARKIKDNPKELASIIEKSLLVMLFVALPISIVSVVFSKEIIVFLSNESFISGSKALVFLAFTLPIMYFDVLLAEILIANDERKLLIKIAIFILSFNFITNLIMIPLFSFMGAAITTFASEILLLLINFHFTKKIIPYKFNLISAYKIILVAIITLVLTFLIKNLALNFLILMAISFVIYGALAYIFRIVTLDTAKELFKPSAN